MALCVGIMNVIEDAPLGPPVDLRAAQAAPCYEQAMSDGGSASVPLFYASASMSAREASELEGCAEEDARDESNDDVQVSRSFSNLSTASHITGWHEREP
mmetsp:Transcript_88599/g.154877  ORF Transcript_88599/g.154877 Transcript_88599/m.154877 type:complete len:100 (+) Transcript_88599:74-373(+)